MTDEIVQNEAGYSSQLMSDGAWLACGALITAIAAFLRFYDLGLKPLHHDEGVNGFFLKTLYDSGGY